MAGKPIAAVLDASPYKDGHFHVTRVSLLARDLLKRGVQLWIPRQIVFEWAVHAYAILDGLNKSHERAFNAGLVESEGPAALGVEEIVERFLWRCSRMANVTVLEMDGIAAAAGIRDQILGTGAGKVVGGTRTGRNALVGGVRTGASDSSWVRDALHCAGGDPTLIVFVTKNVKDVLPTTRALGHDDAAIRYWDGHDLRRFNAIFPAPEPATEPSIDAITAQKLIATALVGEFTDAMVADDRSGPPPEWIEVADVGIGNGLDLGDRHEIDDLLEPGAVIEPLARLVDVRDVVVDADGSDTAVRYVVRLLADVRVDGRVFDNDGHALIDSVPLPARVVSVPYAAVLRDGVLHDVEQTDTADHWSAAQRFEDGEDAFQWLFDNEITAWEHILVTILDGDQGPEGGFIMRGPNGRVETAVLDGPVDGDWELSFEKTGAAIKATYDPGGRVWMGRGESFDLYKPVGLGSEVRGAQLFPEEPYSALAAVWAYLITGENADERDRT